MNDGRVKNEKWKIRKSISNNEFQITKIIHFSMLGYLDSILGAGVGISKAILMVLVAFLSIAAVPSERVRKDFVKSISFRIYKSLPN